MPTENDIAAVVAQRIRIRRKTLGMTQTELGEKLNLSYQQVQKYERGANHVTADRLWQIAQALGVSVEYFYQDIEKLDGIPRDTLIASLGRSDIADCVLELAQIPEEDVKSIVTPLAVRLRSPH